MATAAKFPGTGLALVDVGGEAAGIVTALLSGSHNASVTTITLTATVPTVWPTAGWVTIDSEIIQYAGVSGTTLTGCTRATQTAYGGGIAATHNDQAIVAPYLSPLAWNQTVAEIIAIEKQLLGRTVSLTRLTEDFSPVLIGAASATVNFWTASLTAGTAASLVGVANHPGIIQLDTTVTNPAFIGLHATTGGIGSVLPADSFDMTWIVRPAAAVDANLYFRFGLNDTSTSSTSGTLPTNGIYLEKLPADAGWFECCRAAGTSTRVGGPGTPTNGTFAKWRIRRVDASTIGWSVDGGTENNITTNIPTVALKPFIEVGNNATANSKKLDIDLFDLTVSVTR